MKQRIKIFKICFSQCIFHKNRHKITTKMGHRVQRKTDVYFTLYYLKNSLRDIFTQKEINEVLNYIANNKTEIKH